MIDREILKKLIKQFLDKKIYDVVIPHSEVFSTVLADYIFANYTDKNVWVTAKGEAIPVKELSDKHIVNIVTKFGKDTLLNSGYTNIVNRFNYIFKNDYDGDNVKE